VQPWLSTASSSAMRFRRRRPAKLTGLHGQAHARA
jgi:hypothetical protein